MREDRLTLRMICLFLLLLGLLASNTLAQVINGSLELQVVAGKPTFFSDHPLASGKYPASGASVWIHQKESGFSFDDSTDKEGKLIVSELPVGLNIYEITWRDFREDLWGARGCVLIKKDSMEKELVELNKTTLAEWNAEWIETCY